MSFLADLNDAPSNEGLGHPCTVMGEELIELVGTINILFFFAILGDRHHALCAEVVLVGLRQFELTRLCFDQIPIFTGTRI